MAETLALAVGVPAVLAAACLASRRSWSPAYADNRGIALQTVIVIVVMLVIAGGVAGVLLSRGGDVMSDLEDQNLSTSIDSAAECTATVINSIAGDDSNGVSCRWIGTATDGITNGRCTVVGGTFFATGVAASAITGGHAVGTTAANVNGVCQLAY